MNKKLISLLAISCVLLTGCVSDAEYKSLEQRVSYLEQQLGISQQTAEGNDTPSEISSEEPANISNDETSTSKESYSYYIDNLSDDQVVAECKYYFENIPSQGDSFDSYLSKVKATPVKSYQDYGVQLQFYDNSKRYESTTHDAITAISINGSQTEMDGSIGYSGNSYGVCINMIIQDYNRASNIYDQLYNIIVDEHYRDINDRRDSTNWQADCMFYNNEGTGGYGITFMSMSKEENGYNLSASYYRNF